MAITPIDKGAAWRGGNRYGRPFRSLSVSQQLMVILDESGRDHMHRDKSNSAKTKKNRAYVCHQAIEQLRSAGYAVKNLMNLDTRHAETLLATWKEQGMAPGTLAGRITILRWLYACVGKPRLIQDPSAYSIQRQDIQVSGVATVDKSWSSKGAIPKELIEQIRSYDEWVASQLELMYAFGLRVTEAILLKPRASHIDSVLRVEEGTKGGRGRFVKIRDQEQLEVLDRAKRLSLLSKKGAMVQPGKTPEQARRRLYYICEKFGITKDQLNITPHGLRHEYANDLYEEISGTPSTVRGGSVVLDHAKEIEALNAVTSDMGHARLAITSAYTGSRKRLAAMLTSKPPVPNNAGAVSHSSQSSPGQDEQSSF